MGSTEETALDVLRMISELSAAAVMADVAAARAKEMATGLRARRGGAGRAVKGEVVAAETRAVIAERKAMAVREALKAMVVLGSYA